MHKIFSVRWFVSIYAIRITKSKSSDSQKKFFWAHNVHKLLGVVLGKVFLTRVYTRM
jgi:cytochrome b561